MTYPQQPDQPQYIPPAPPPRRKRRVWPWVLLGVVLVPILVIAACTALLSAGISGVEQARQGGTVAIGETFTYQSGLALTVSAPTPYTPSNEFVVPDGQTAYEVTVSAVNGTPNPVGATLIRINATVSNTPAQQVFDGAILPTQDIAPGQQLDIPFRFQVPDGTTGPLQIAVTDSFNEPVFFTGALG